MGGEVRRQRRRAAGVGECRWRAAVKRQKKSRNAGRCGLGGGAALAGFGSAFTSLARYELRPKTDTALSARRAYSPVAARSAAVLPVFWPALTSLRDMSFVHVRKAARAARRAYSPAAARSAAALWSAFTSLRDMNSAPKPKGCCTNTGLYSPAAARSAWALSVFSQLNSGSSRPKWP